MAMVGYGKLKVGDTIHEHGTGSTKIIEIEEGSPYVGQTFWIYKNSWGDDGNWGDYGYMYHANGQYLPEYCRYLKQPIVDLVNPDREIEFFDKDNDGYYNWGIGERPDECPETKSDSDDSEPRLGPFDDNYYSTPVAPQITVNVGSYEIKHGGFYSFSGDTTLINFIITNKGNAQLNLKEEITGEGPIYIAGINSDSFNVYHEPANHIAMDDGQDTFTIQYIGEDWLTNIAEIRIALDEFDMDDFVFGLVHTAQDCPGLGTIEVISGTEEWSGFQFKDHAVRVNDGGVLTITGNIGFVEDAYLNISRGGKVYIDNGTLTKACNLGLWKGINVSGNARESQGYEDEHGLLRISNGGIIEYAEIAVETTSNDDTPDPNYYGGIIYANQGVFRNNLVDVKINPFRNTHPVTGDPYRNLSYFTNCYFLTTSGLYDLLPPFVDPYIPENHLKLIGVDGIPINGCFFENSDMTKSDPDDRGNGIYAYNAGFEVTYSKPLLQGGDRLRSEFRALNYGIKAMSGLTSPPVSVDSCYFRDNSRGIYLSAIDYPELIYNEFLLKGDNTLYDETDTLAGIYLNDESVGYVVEENIFYNHEDYDPLNRSLHTVGIVANSTGTSSNEIYNNYFEQLDYGTLAINRNRSTNGLTGLQVLCNEYINCEYDIAVTKEVVGGGLGIRINQGSQNIDPAAPAGNRFSQIDIHEESDYSNECENIVYHHHKEQQSPPYDKVIPLYYTDPPIISLNENQLYNFDEDESCPSNLTNEGGGIEEEKSLLVLNEYKADSVNNLLTSLKDGGSTDELNTEVLLSWPEDAYDVYSELMTNSPYLTDTVMVSSVEKEDVLNSAMVTDILSSNPQAAKSDTIMQSLENRLNQLTDEQRAQIDQGLYILGAMESLQAKLSHYKTERNRSFDKIIRYYKDDTILTTARDSIIHYFERESNLEAQYRLALEYLGYGDTTHAVTCLNSIPNSFSLNTMQQNEHQYYEDYFDILIGLKADGRTVLQADSAEIATLFTILNNSSGKINALVRNTMISLDSLGFDEDYVFPTGLKTGRVRYEPSDFNYEEDKLRLYPNPAGDYVVIKFTLTNETGDSRIIFIDSKGIQVKAVNLENKHDYLVVSVKDLPNGVYICTLMKNRKKIQTVKLSKADY